MSQKTFAADVRFAQVVLLFSLFALFGCHPSSSGSKTGFSTPLQKTFENTLGMKFVSIPNVPVLVSIWDTRVEDYRQFVLATGATWPATEFEQGPTHPAVNISWADAMEFCRWLTAKERAEKKILPAQAYRLPTDFEWSNAAALPTEPDMNLEVKNRQVIAAYPWGKQWPPPPGAGNYCDLSFYKKYQVSYHLAEDSYIPGYYDGFPDTSPVGSFNPNAFGLFDMGGNVWQWCGDWYDNSRTERVLRGASFTTIDYRRAMLGFRYHLNPNTRYANYGFRCVLANE